MEHAKVQEALSEQRRMDFFNAKPSQKIRMAIDDLIQCRAHPEKFRLDMREWCYTDPSDNLCAVCVAGAVMAQRLNMRETPEELRLESCFFENEFRSLNDVRVGGLLRLSQAAQRFGLSKWQIMRLRFKYLAFRKPEWMFELDNFWFKYNFDSAICQLHARADLFKSVGA